MTYEKEFSNQKLRRTVALGALLTFVLGGDALFRLRVRASTGVHALFDLTTTAGGPFPSDWFTVEDPSHNTGRRVNLPFPDCEARRSDCEDLAVLNTLDGFNLQPRLSLPFDGPIDVSTVTSDAVFLINLVSTLDHGRAKTISVTSSAITAAWFLLMNFV